MLKRRLIKNYFKSLKSSFNKDKFIIFTQNSSSSIKSRLNKSKYTFIIYNILKEIYNFDISMSRR